jgi:threonine/homoserine/homoserine lactone efflux protein
MIAEHLLWPYLIASLICILTPGSDSLGTLSLGLAHGRKHAMSFALGVGVGCLTHTLWAAIGVAAVVMASQDLFTALKLLGALYLVYLGVSSWRGAAQSMAQMTHRTDALSNGHIAEGALTGKFFQGFVSNAINPKVMLFFLAFLPQFVDASLGQTVGPIWMQMLSMGIGFAVLTGASYCLLGWVSGGAGIWVRQNPRFLFWVNRIAGLLFIGLALRLALAERK